MVQDSISRKSAFSIIVLIQISNSIIIGSEIDAGTSAWISQLISGALALLLMLLYARLIHIMPDKNLFQMFEFAFGRVIAVIIGIIYAFYFLTVLSATRGYYAEFIHLTSLQQTSLILIFFSFFIICSYIAKSGIQTMGKWCSLIVAISVIATFALFCFSLQVMELNNIQPYYNGNNSAIIQSGLVGTILPLSEAVTLLTFANTLDKKVNPYKLFITATLFSTAFLLAVYLITMSVLGENVVRTVYFPLFTSASIIQISNMGTRLETLVTLIFLLAGISKVASNLTAGAITISGIFRTKSPYALVVPVGYFTVALSEIYYSSIMDMFETTAGFFSLSVLVQAIIPVFAWICCEIKIKAKNIPVRKCWKDQSNDSSTQIASDDFQEPESQPGASAAGN